MRRCSWLWLASLLWCGPVPTSAEVRVSRAGDGAACDEPAGDDCCPQGTPSGPSQSTTGDCGWDWLDRLNTDQPLLHDLRQRTLAGDVTYSVGGELRYRWLDERNRLRPMGEIRRDTYNQWRFTPFLEVGNDWVTGYVQAIDAPTFDEDLPIVPIDENRFDLLQSYVDMRLIEFDRGELRGRYGRIFLQYGDQHLVSPLGWANTFRNFEGGQLYYVGEDWNVDGFVVRPLNGAASAAAFHPRSFDQADQSVLFSGVYATYKKARYGTFDLYWLWNDEDEPNTNRQDGSRHTLGARSAGKIPVKHREEAIRTWSWDLGGGWQFGEDRFQPVARDQNVSAGFLSAIGGVTFDAVPWSPGVSGLFWWGSGDGDPTDGDISTLTTLYPFGHFYWGQIDNFNGANLLDYSVQLSAKPTGKLTLACHWHWFDKATASDYIYNIAGAPLGNTTTADRNLGHELDLLATYAFNANLSVQAGYFWFWYGDAVDNNAGIPPRDDAEQFYLMATWGF